MIQLTGDCALGANWSPEPSNEPSLIPLLELNSRDFRCSTRSAQLGRTKVELPLGGVASSIPAEVRRPKIVTCGLLAAAVGAAFVVFVLIRLLL
jgi:hypothetical protein